ERIAAEDVAVARIGELAAAERDEAARHVANDGGDRLGRVLHLRADVALDGVTGLREPRGERPRCVPLAAGPGKAVAGQLERVRVAARRHPRAVERVGILIREYQKA